MAKFWLIFSPAMLSIKFILERFDYDLGFRYLARV